VRRQIPKESVDKCGIGKHVVVAPLAISNLTYCKCSCSSQNMVHLIFLKGFPFAKFQIHPVIFALFCLAINLQGGRVLREQASAN
jgi:hypothetical protein